VNAGAALGLAVRSLRRHRVRTSLAMLGIVIGIAAVICMVALGQGASGMVQAQLDSMGRNLLMILPGAASSSGGFSFGGGTGVTLTPDDAKAILEQVPSLLAVSPVERTRGQQLVYEAQNWVPSSILGVGETFPLVRNWPVDEGSFFDKGDVLASAKTCLVGRTVADNLFAGDSPVGKRMRIKNIPFQVVGVLTPKGTSSMGSDQDDVVIVPWTSCLNLLEGSAFENIDQILAATHTPEELPGAIDEIREVLRARHHLLATQPDDFRLQSMAEFLTASAETSDTMSKLLAGIASISLLVGGIGIMNIMLVSVTERTREIGIRLAIGARERDVLLQFLVEAMMMSGLGGLMGIAMGLSASAILVRFFALPFVPSAEIVLLAFMVSAGIGIAFGYFPARRAARLDPIEALRHE